jgi:glycine/D-amino acid oxidase-like deaminating enzyme
VHFGAGKDVVVLEARTRGSGQTGRTTAHLMTWNDDYYHMIDRMYGADVLKVVGDSHKKSVDWVEKVRVSCLPTGYTWSYLACRIGHLVDWVEKVRVSSLCV